MRRLHALLTRGLTATAEVWPAIETAYAWVHRAAHLLANAEERSARALRAAYAALLAKMRAHRTAVGRLAPAIDQFLKVTASYWPGLFHCYAVADLPRTNNDLEHFFGSARYHERRATGHKKAAASTVLRGSVRLVAAVATRQHCFRAADLRPTDLVRWREVRRTLASRHAGRRAQLRFRRNPAVYLAALEAQFLQLTLPS